MNKTIKLACLSMLFATTIHAQHLSSSYFMEGSLYRHQLNPAFDAPQNYFSMPLAGNIYIGVRGNLGLSDVLFNHGGRTVTFLHPDIPVVEALSGIKNNNKLISDIHDDIVSVGFQRFGGYNTITIGARTFAGTHLPYDLFDLTKNLTNKDYKVGETGARAQAYAELAFGHSRQLDRHWRVGGKVKVLVGIARVDAEIDDLSLNLQSTDVWTASAHAKVEANVKGLTITDKQKAYEDETKGSYTTIDDLDIEHPGIGGIGAAVDLGTEYDFSDLVPGLKASFAILDLGFIGWNSSHTLVNNGKDFRFEGFKDVAVEGGPGEKLSQQTDRLVDDLADLYNLQNQGDQGSSSHAIGTTMNIGVEYALPAYSKVRFGLLSSTRFQGDYSWNEERLSVNYAPTSWFELNINGAVGTFGPSAGWMVNLHPVGFNLFLGMDHVLGKVSKQWVPLRSNADFSLGINFPLSKPRRSTN